MKIALIGNCQVTPMKMLIEASLPEVTCTAWEVFAMTEADCAAAAKTLFDFDAILAQPLVAPRYNRLVMSALQTDHSARCPLLFFHNLHFEGAMPDCTYVGKLGNRLPSPIAGYHSRIVRDAFLAGYNTTEAEARLRTGYGIDVLVAWSRSIDEFKKREHQVNVPFADELEAHVRQENSFHVFNHPTIALIARYTEKILNQLLGSTSKRRLDGRVHDILASYGAWPVWPWVADAVGLDYASCLYIPPGKEGIANLLPHEFVKACYAVYASHPRENIV